jgi:hypothetical protein
MKKTQFSLIYKLNNNLLSFTSLNIKYFNLNHRLLLAFSKLFYKIFFNECPNYLCILIKSFSNRTRSLYNIPLIIKDIYNHSYVVILSKFANYFHLQYSITPRKPHHHYIKKIEKILPSLSINNFI